MQEQPLIICGMGRSGTRTVADVLSAHRKVQLYGEIPPHMMEAFLSLLDVMDKGYLNDKSFTDDWRARKLDYIFESFNFLSKEFSKTRKSYRLICGYKSPRHERFFAEFERHFNSIDVNAHYIYCTRDPVSCWASYKSMPWNKFTLNAFIEDYKNSIQEYRIMKNSAPDRVHLFDLNEYTKSYDKFEFFKSRFLTPLNLVDNDGIRKIILADLNRNATSTVTGKPRETLLPEEVDTIGKALGAGLL